MRRSRNRGIALQLACFLSIIVCLPGWAQSDTDLIEWDEALDQAPGWYESAEAVRIADNVLLYQHASGGWPKNIDMAEPLSAADRDRIRREQAEGGTTLSNITIDNGATYTPMRYLARVYETTGEQRFKEGFLRGVDYLLEAQYENGGWPQYYPIREGYYENITFNDDAMIGAMRMLRDAAEGEGPYSFVDSSRRRRAAAAVEKGVEAILKMQIIQEGERTAWCAQHDPETLEPIWARSYEPPSLAGAASVGIVRFLMSVEEPGPEIIAAVEGAVEWFRSVAIRGHRFEEFIDDEGREDKRLVEDPDAGPLWARFYQIGTNRPIFVNRDSEIYYSISKIPQERRGGYDWYGDWAEELLAEEYPVWRENWAEGPVPAVQDLEHAIRPSAEHPFYWEYEGEPVLLIGGSDDDNLFQWTGDRLTDHLELLASVGGNYVRNTMSDRDEDDIYAFAEVEEGVYDLEQWNEEYWDRLEFFLQETSERDIIVQLTLWDHFDFHEGHPWHPVSNVNYGLEVMGDEEDFYGGSVLDENEEILDYQRRFVDKILSISLQYGNVLYNINNEGSEPRAWDNYWASYLQNQAADQGREIYVTSMMFDPPSSVRRAMTYRDIYAYTDISQNNQDSRGARGPAHYSNVLSWRKKLASDPMPMNNVKIYGAGVGQNYSAGTGKEATSRLWKNVFAGAASARFHRPEGDWGIGLNEHAQANLKAMSMLQEEFDLFETSPHPDLLHSYVGTPASSMEAYCLAEIGEAYAVYFPEGRYTIELDPWVYADRVRIRWLDIDEGSWSEPEVRPVTWEGSLDNWGYRGRIRLTTPSNTSAVALVEVVEMR